MEWVIEGVNYWENPDCPREYLEQSLITLVEEVEDITLSKNFYSDSSREYIQQKIAFYESVLDK